MTKILVTGASGFVGRRLVPLLMRDGHEVHAQHRRAGQDLPTATAWHQADLLIPAEGPSLVAKVRPEVLVHLAWIAEPGRFWTSSDNLDWVGNTLRLARALEESGGRRLVGAGTCAEYDWSHAVCHPEQTPLQPGLLYGSAKVATYQLLQSFCESRRMSFAWGRIFHLYGPGEHPSKVVASVIRSLLRHQSVDLSHGRQVRDYLHVDDVASAFSVLAQGDFEGPINIGSGSGTSLRDLLTSIGDLLQREDLLRFGARNSDGAEPRKLIADATALRSLGWTPAFDQSAGLATAVDYWRRQLGEDCQ